MSRALAGLRADAGRRSPGRPRNERLSRRILEVARDQVSELGYARTSMESVAAAAGVSRTTLYRRYRDKADLVSAAIAEAIPPASDPGDGPSRDAVVAFLEALEERLGGPCFEVLTSLLAAREEPLALALHRERIIAPRFAALRRLLERAQDEGELAADADLDLAAEMLVGSVFARRVAGTPAPRGWAQRAVAALFAGMASPRA